MRLTPPKNLHPHQVSPIIPNGMDLSKNLAAHLRCVSNGRAGFRARFPEAYEEASKFSRIDTSEGPF